MVDKLVIAAPQMMDPNIASTAKMGLNTFSNNSTIIILYLVTKKNRCLISLLYVQSYTCWNGSYTISLLNFSTDKGEETYQIPEMTLFLQWIFWIVIIANMSM